MGLTFVHGALLAALLSSSAMAIAQERPQLAPPPAWATVSTLPPPEEGDKKVFLLYDNQIQIAGGKSTAFSDAAYQVISPEMLSSAGNVKIEWQPDTQDILVHAVDIVRDGKTIDALGDGSGFDVIRREANLEKLSIDGALTATMQLTGLQLGDIIRLQYSRVDDDPALQGHVAGLQTLPRAPVEVGRYQMRLLWPETTTLNWAASEGVDLTEERRDGMREVRFEGVLPKAKDQPDQAPSRFVLPPFISYTTFGDWEAVSRTASALYEERAGFASDGDLAKEVAKIAAAGKDPMARMVSAVDLVQSKVRYLYKGMDFGNYTPQTPDSTWEQRYGDCKAKTLLLLTVLRELGITAQPMMVSAEDGDAVARLKPGFYPFDHVVVRASIDDRDYWLDGTAQGTTASNIADVSNFYVALPLTPAGTGLIDVPVRPLSQPTAMMERIIDISAGLGLPVIAETKVTLTGDVVAALKGLQAQLDEKSFGDQLDTIIKGLGNEAIVTAHSLRFTDDDRTAILTGRSIETYDWIWRDQRYQTEMEPPVESIRFNADRSRAAWREIPVKMPHPAFESRRVSIILPKTGQAFEMKGPLSFDQTIAGTQYTYAYAMDTNRVEATLSERTIANEITADQLPAIRTAIAKAKAEKVRLLAPGDTESLNVAVRLADKAGQAKALRAAYDEAVSQADPDDMSARLARAGFLSKIGDYPAAIADLNIVLAAQPDADNYLWMSALQELGDPEAALESVENARALEPASDTAMYQMAKIYWLHSRPDEMLAALEAFGSMGVEQNDLDIVHAKALAQAGQPDKALAVMDAAFARKPGDAQLFRARCDLKAGYGIALDSALKDCTRAAELSENSSNALENRGLVHWRLGRKDDAADDWRSALLAYPDSSHARYFLGMATGGGEGKRQRELALMVDPELPLEVKIWNLDN